MYNGAFRVRRMLARKQWWMGSMSMLVVLLTLAGCSPSSTDWSAYNTRPTDECTYSTRLARRRFQLDAR